MSRTRAAALRVEGAAALQDSGAQLRHPWLYALLVPSQTRSSSMWEGGLALGGWHSSREHELSPRNHRVVATHLKAAPPSTIGLAWGGDKLGLRRLLLLGNNHPLLICLHSGGSRL
jgi:hypothetical protein